jgi:hypothetical protein
MGERYSLLAILPEQGARITMITVADIVKRVAPTEEEKKRWGINETGNGGLRWEPKMKDVTVDLEFSKPELMIIKKALNDKDAKEQLTLSELPLCEKFM